MSLNRSTSYNKAVSIIRNNGHTGSIDERTWLTDELGFDSLGITEFTMQLEEALGVVIDDKLLDADITHMSLGDYITRLLEYIDTDNSQEPTT